MAIQTVTMRNSLAGAYKAAALYGALYTTVPAGTAGTEVTGGSPVYARKSLAGWSVPAASATTVTVTFDVGPGVTVLGAGIHDAVSAGNYLDGAGITSQNFATQGTFDVTFTFTQT